nr:IQ domain-containing protein F5-like [Caretta caretta]
MSVSIVTSQLSPQGADASVLKDPQLLEALLFPSSVAGVKALEGSPRKKPDAKALKNCMVTDPALGGGDGAQRQLSAAPDSLQQLGAPDQAAAMDQKAISPALAPAPEKDPSWKSAIAIQSWWRGVLTRRTVRQATLCVLMIQRWWRRVSFRGLEERRVRALAMYVRPVRASVLLQSLVRMWRARSQYKAYQRAVLVIQNERWQYSCRREAVVFAGSSLADGGVDLNIEIIVG